MHFDFDYFNQAVFFSTASACLRQLKADKDFGTEVTTAGRRDERRENHTRCDLEFQTMAPTRKQKHKLCQMLRGDAADFQTHGNRRRSLLRNTVKDAILNNSSLRGPAAFIHRFMSCKLHNCVTCFLVCVQVNKAQSQAD